MYYAGTWPVWVAKASQEVLGDLEVLGFKASVFSG